MKCKVFHATNVDERKRIEGEINLFLGDAYSDPVSTGTTPKYKFVAATQSEFGVDFDWGLTITVWYEDAI